MFSSLQPLYMQYPLKKERKEGEEEKERKKEGKKQERKKKKGKER